MVEVFETALSLLAVLLSLNVFAFRLVLIGLPLALRTKPATANEAIGSIFEEGPFQSSF